MSVSLSAPSQALSVPYFDIGFYLNSNPDVLAAVSRGEMTAFEHFVNHGAKEGRSPAAQFNAAAYLIAYPDVANAVGSGQMHSAWYHFVTFGVLEGRSNGSFSGEFDEAAYLAANQDVADAVEGGGFRSAHEHFLLHGANEGRVGFTTDGVAINPPPPPPAGQVFTLTAGTDFLIGTDGDDLFIGRAGIDDNNPNATADASDVLDGGAGRNTLRLALYSNEDNPGLLPTTTNIQVLEVTSNYNDQYSVAGMRGLEEVIFLNTLAQLRRPADLLGFTNLVDAGIVNSNQKLELRFASGVAAGDADEMTLTLDGAIKSFGYSAELRLRFEDEEKLETLNIVSQNEITGRIKNVVDLNVDNGLKNLNISVDANLVIGDLNSDIQSTLENITISGAGSLTIADSLGTAVKTVDASGNTGGVNIDAGNSNVLKSVFTGDGDDRVIVSLAALASGAEINLGGGTNTLAVSKGSSYTTASDLTNFNFTKVSNVQVLELLDDVSLASNLTLDLAGLPELTTLKLTDFDVDGNFRLTGIQDLTIASGEDFKVFGVFSGTFRDLTINAADDVFIGFYDKDNANTTVSSLRDLTVIAGESASVYFYNYDENNAYASLQSIAVEAGQDAFLGVANSDGSNFMQSLQSISVEAGEDARVYIYNENGSNFMQSLQSIAVEAGEDARVYIYNEDGSYFMQSLQSIAVEAGEDARVYIENDDGLFFMQSLQSIAVEAGEDVTLDIENDDGLFFMQSLQSIVVEAGEDARVYIYNDEGVNFMSALESIDVTAGNRAYINISSDGGFSFASLETIKVMAGASVSFSLDLDSDAFDAFSSLRTIEIEVTDGSFTNTEVSLDGDSLGLQNFRALESIVVSSTGNIYVYLDYISSEAFDVVLSTTESGNIGLFAYDTPGLKSLTISGEANAYIYLSGDQSGLETIDLRGMTGGSVTYIGAYYDDLGGAVSILIGEGDLDYYTNSGNGSTERFVFTSRDIGDIFIEGFDTGNTDGDILDFSQLNLTGGFLHRYFGEDGNDIVEVATFAESDYIVITASGLNGSITLVGVDHMALSNNVIFA